MVSNEDSEAKTINSGKLKKDNKLNQTVDNMLQMISKNEYVDKRA